MGLDVSMYALKEGVTREQFEEAAAKHDEAENAFYERDDYESLSDDVKKAERQRIREEFPDPEGEYLGFDKDKGKSQYDHEHSLAKEIEIPSEKYPDLYSKIGYWRSSYNSGGINSVLRNYGLKDLYWITFGDEGLNDESYFVWPDWSAVRDRATRLIAEWDAKMKEVGDCRVVEMDNFGSMGMHEPPLSSEEEAIKRYLDEKEKHPEFGAYESHRGFFSHGEPLEVIGVMPGLKQDILGYVKGDADAKIPTVFLIVKGGPHESYRQTLEVVLETAEYALANGPERHYLHWSG